MLDVVDLALPYFGLIFIGYACGRLKKIPDTGLAWMNFFLIYVALPCLFFRVLAKTPLQELNNIPFVLGTTLSTYAAFAVSFALAMAFLRGHVAEASIAGMA